MCTCMDSEVKKNITKEEITTQKKTNLIQKVDPIICSTRTLACMKTRQEIPLDATLFLRNMTGKNTKTTLLVLQNCFMQPM